MYCIKWYLAAIGYIFLGSVGAITGFILGVLGQLCYYIAKMPDNPKTKHSNKHCDTNSNVKTNKGADKYHYHKSIEKEPDYSELEVKDAITLLMASVMKEDGSVTKAEVNSVKPFLLKHYGETEAIDALHKLKIHIQESRDYLSASMCIKQQPYSTRLDIVRILVRIAHANQDDNTQKINLVKRIVLSLDVSLNDYEEIHKLFHAATANNKYNDWAYQILEVTRSATNDEIKRAYHAMAIKYHPDKVSGLDSNVAQDTNDKFRSIIAAYESIKRERKIQ